jgi:cell division protein FtsL
MKKKKKISVMDFIGGKMLKKTVVKHTKMIVLLVFLFFVYISNHYACLMKIREIVNLQTELKEVKYEATQTSAILTSNTRPSQVEELVKKQGLDLEKATTPPYKLK